MRRREGAKRNATGTAEAPSCDRRERSCCTRAKNFIIWGGIGFGTAHPTNLVVGSDPSVMVTRIRWHGWGRRRASGVGRYAAPHYGRSGSYYRKQFRADLRGSRIGGCHPNGPRTYMALKVRVALQPGQRPSW